MAATAGNDKLRGSDSADFIRGYGGNDTIWGYEGADTLQGDTDNDLLYGGDDGDTFVYAIGDGNDTIADYTEDDKIRFTNSTPTESNFSVKGNNVIITVGTGSRKGTITILNAVTNGKVNKTITYLDSNGDEHTYPQVVYYNDKRTGATLLSGFNEDAYDATALDSNFNKLVTIDGSAVTHDFEITGNKKANKIFGGTGDDTIYGGKGADTLSGGDGNDVFAYAAGDGKDVITDYEMGDLIKITSGVLKGAAIVGNDYVLSVGNGQITVKNAKDKYLQVETADGETVWYPEDPVDSLVYYSGGTLSVKQGYRGDVIDVADVESGFAGKVYNIEASGVAHSLHIIANKSANSIIGTAQDDTIEGLAGADTIVGGKGDDILYGGAGNDVFVYDKGDGNDQILDYASGDTILFRDEDGTFGVTGTVKSGSDLVIKLTDKSEITVVGGASKKVKIKSDTIDDGDHMIVGKKGSSVLLLSSYGDDSFDVTDSDAGYTFADSVMTIDASAVDHTLKITGNKKKNLIVGTDQKDTIDGGAGADTINGGAGNDVLTGGDGADVFIYNSGDGNDRITDYTAEDSIVIDGVTVKSTVTANSGNDLVLRLSDGKQITVVGGIGTTVTGSVGGTETIFYGPTIPPVPDLDNVLFNENYTAATLTSDFEGESFTVDDYSVVKKRLKTIDASKVESGLTLGGSAIANNIIGTDDDDYIYGGKGRDTLNGGKGNDSLEGGAGNDKLYGGTGKDTLWGGAGDDQLTGGGAADTFIYNADGNDRITDYVWGTDKIVCLEGTITNAAAVGSDVVFTMSNGNTLTLANASGKSAQVVDGSGNILKQYQA